MVYRILTVLLLLVISNEAAAQYPPLPSIAPPASTQLDPEDWRRALIIAASFVRGEHISTGRDSIVLDARQHATEEVELLLSELRAQPGTLESLQKNCRPLRGCELTAAHFIMFGRPIPRTDGTLTILVEHSFRTTSTRQPTASTAFEMVLTRTGGTWTVTSARTLFIT